MGRNLIAAVLAVVAFKDAAKIKSWDAWVDLMTGRICKLPDVTSVPVWDSPVMIVPTWEVQRALDLYAVRSR